MAYSAQILEVMIASPGDVAAERQVVREVINEWNVMHSRTRKVLMVPVGWETSAAPELGGRPQQMINDRLLAHCDLLVGIFWTRLGSPTGASASGTAEEIEEHIKAGKPAMLYFSRAPVVPDSIDAEQYGKLQEFKKWAMEKGIISHFDNAEEFRQNLRRDVEINLRDNKYLADVVATAGGNDDPEESRKKTVRLSGDAVEMLRLAAADREGEIMVRSFVGGESISTGRHHFITERSDRRETARWEAALEQLENYGLIKATSYKRSIFRVTHQGYEAAGQFPALSDGASKGLSNPVDQN